MAGIQLISPELAESVAARCLEQGIITRVITNGTLQLSPPFIATDAEIELCVEVIRSSLTALAEV
jgi:adenosylmethionine-8-amino-7-oxononanoate aminotransferase